MANIKDVAKLAGVSVSSVSKAYNGYSDIKPQTKEKILKAAHELGYVPNNFASNLSKKFKNSIGIIIQPNQNLEYIDEIIMLYIVSTVQGAKNNNLEPYILLHDKLEEMTASELRNYFSSKGISGVILFGLSANDKMLSSTLSFTDIKKVIIDAQHSNKHISSISLNDLQAQYDIFKDLYTYKKYRNFLYISGSDEAFVSIERKNGVIKFQKEFPDVSITIKNGNFNQQYVENIIKNINLSNFDCIVCASDMMAFNVKQIIGDSICVCGFDNIRLIQLTYPNIPTISQNFYLKGIHAVEELKRLLNGGEGQIIHEPYEVINIKS